MSVVERLCSAPAVTGGRLLPQEQYGRQMSSSVPSTCIITENPDIAGIGVRLSIYIPAILVTLNSGFVTGQVFVDIFTGKLSESIPPAPPKPSLGDANSVSGSDIELADLEAAGHADRSSSPARTTSSSIPPWTSDNSALRTFRGYLSYISDHPHYFESAKSLERSLFLIGSAIIVSAFLDARGVTSTIGLPPYHALLVLNLSLLNNLAGSSFLPFRIGAIFATIEVDDEDDEHTKGIMSKTIWWSIKFFDVFGLGGYSMTVDALLSSPLYNSTVAVSSSGSLDPSQCVSKTFYWAFIGSPIESTLSLQVISFIFYVGTASVPFLGIFVTVVPTIILFRTVPIFLGLSFSSVIYSFGIILPRITPRLIYILLPKLSYPHPTQPLFPTRLSPSAISTKLIFFAMMITNQCTVVFLIISTEKTISINSASQKGLVVINGAQWTYGQTLALMSAVIGVLMYAAEVVGHWREAWIERRKRMRV
ncbi:hypothetical protein EV359DRAFT_86947 [Lentinula novae-zelandiae]|nr:hypothetical protein EV359DRAFT_86947 [Lentinula novae-zelandiae]